MRFLQFVVVVFRHEFGSDEKHCDTVLCLLIIMITADVPEGD
jgi:hypothetical protein